MTTEERVRLTVEIHEAIAAEMDLAAAQCGPGQVEQVVARTCRRFAAFVRGRCADERAALQLRHAIGIGEVQS